MRVITPPTPGPLVIVGAGGFGRECLDIVDALNGDGCQIDMLGFVDDGTVNHDLLNRLGAELLGTSADPNPSWSRYIIGIGDGNARRHLDQRLSESGLDAISVIHPAATIGREVTCSAGVVVCAGVRITTNIRIGRCANLHVNSTVGHDSVIGDFASVFPGATISGNVELGNASTIGTGANVLPGITIGEGAFVGAGAVVVSDVAPHTTVIGVPARVREV